MDLRIGRLDREPTKEPTEAIESKDVIGLPGETICPSE